MAGKHAADVEFDTQPVISHSMGERRLAIHQERLAAQKVKSLKKKRGVIDWILICIIELMVSVFVLSGSFFLWKFYINDSVENTAQTSQAEEMVEKWTSGTSIGSLDYDPQDPIITAEPADRTEFAVIYIPRLGAMKPIVQGTSRSNLALGAAHYPGSAMPGDYGNFAVAGHRNTVFVNLKAVVPGDNIYIQTADGYYTYQVVDPHYIVKPTDVQVVAPIPGELNSTNSQAEDIGQRMLTLTTCWPEWSNTERLILHAEFIEWRPLEAGAPAEIR